MNDYMLYLLISNIIDIIILIIYYNAFFSDLKYKRIYFVAAYAISLFTIFIVNQLENPILNLITTFIIITLFSFLYKSPRNYKCIIILGYISIGIVTEPIGILILQLMKFNRDNLSLYGIVSLLCELIRLFIVIILSRIKSIKEKKVPNKTALVITLSFSLNIIICILLVKLSFNFNNNFLIAIVFIIVFALLTSNYLLFSLIEKITLLLRSHYENIIYKQDYDFQKKYYEEIDNQIQELQKVRHDYKNELLTLYNLLSNDSSAALDMLCNYIADIDTLYYNIYSHNKYVNSILNVKFSVAKKLNIQITSYVFVPKEMKLKYSEIGIIFGNLLDNAINANLSISNGKRYILLKAQYLNNFLFLHIENPYTSTLTVHQASDHIHGYGLKNVKQVIEQHNGIIKTTSENNIYQVDIILYDLKN